jgi:Phage tail tube protein, GTA-gp10
VDQGHVHPSPVVARRTARVRLFFGDEEHDFRLGIGEAETLDEETGFGLMELLNRTESIHVRELRAILRNGLIGAGMKREPAFRLVQRHLVEGYLVEAAAVAANILVAAMRGVPDDMPGEKLGAEPKSPRSQTADSVSA